MAKPIQGMGGPMQAGGPGQNRNGRAGGPAANVSGPQGGPMQNSNAYGNAGYLDANVELSPEATEAAGPGQGKGKGKGQAGKPEGFKNHGQMVKAAREAGYSGKDLAGVAKGETEVDPGGLAAIKDGVINREQYAQAQAAIGDDQFTRDAFLGGLDRVKNGELTFAQLVEELKNPAQAPDVQVTALEDAPAPPPALALEPEPAAEVANQGPGTAISNEGMQFMAMRRGAFRF